MPQKQQLELLDEMRSKVEFMVFFSVDLDRISIKRSSYDVLIAF